MPRQYSNQLNPNPSAFAPNVNPTKPLDLESIDYQARISAELEALNAAVDAFQNDKDENGQSKTEQAILAAGQEVNRIKGELFAAEQKLSQVVAAGSAVDKYNAGLIRVESGFTKLVQLYTQKVSENVVAGWFGQKVSLQALSPDRKKEVKLHKRITDLAKFTYLAQERVERKMVGGRVVTTISLDNIKLRTDLIGNKLVELRDHIEKDSAK
jgi:hypothetical protein